MIKASVLLAIVAVCNAVPIHQQLIFGQQPLTIAQQPLTIAHHQPTFQLAHHGSHFGIPVQFAAAPKPAVVAVSAPAPASVIVEAAPAPATEPVDHHPQYSYSYKVSDAQTGDEKEASETRDGDAVSGKYSLVEPDGSLRTVTYTADKDNGFQATVQRDAPKVAVQPAPVVVNPVPVKSVVVARPAPAVQYVAVQQAPAYHPIHPIHHAPLHSYVQPSISLASHAQPQYQYVLSH